MCAQGTLWMRILLTGAERLRSRRAPLSGSLPALMAEAWPVKAGTLYARAFFDLPLRT